MTNPEKAEESREGESPQEALSGIEELGLTLEQIEQFEVLLGKETFEFVTPWEYQHSYKDFQSRWSEHHTLESKKHMLEIRRRWIEMKQAGGAFEKFFEYKLKELLDHNDTSGVYRYLFAYMALGYENAPVFCGEVLGHKSVWANADGSTLGRIFQFLGKTKDPKAAEAILQFINHVTSKEYERTRKEHQTHDLEEAARVLQEVLGEKTEEVLQALADEDTTFAGWFEKRKLTLLSQKSLTSYYTKLEFEEFNEELEAERLQRLDEEYEEFRENPPSTPQSGWSPESFSDPFGKAKPLTPFQEESPLPAKPRDVLEIDYTFSPWEKDKLVNFYGRFTPKLKEGIAINHETYMASLFATVSSEVRDDNEDHFNFLCGVTREEFATAELPETLSIEHAYHMAALTFSRALCLSVLEGNHDEAISEVGLLKEFFASVAEKMTDEKEIAFMLSLSNQLNEVQGHIAESKEAPSSPELPESAKSFLLYHATLKRSRQIPDFRTLLSEKIRWYLSLDIFHRTKDIGLKRDEERISPRQGPSFQHMRSIVSEYDTNLKLYQKIEDQDVPLYWEARETLDDLDARRIVVFGRDGRFFFVALKASDFGLAEQELKYVVVTSPMKEHLFRPQVKKYLTQNGVTLDFTFVDSGFSGSIPRLAIEVLAEAGGVSLSTDEIDKRIKLLAARLDLRRRELSRKTASPGDRERSIERIEDRPQRYARPSSFVEDDDGTLHPYLQPHSVETQLQAWTVEHATMRNFAPRLDAEKHIAYIRENPLAGYTFIQNYHGNYIGTHPLELWEDKNGKKVLIKGGPPHTVQADFVGQKFLANAGIEAPKAELIRLGGNLKLKLDKLEGWREGGINLPEKQHTNEKIQVGILVDALLGQYDRTPWNLMFKEDDVAFIDNGASLYSRARGGYKGFPNHFDVSQLQEILSSPQFPGQPVNEAYHNVMEVRDGVIIVKNKDILSSALVKLRNITDVFIDETIEQAGFSDSERAQARLEDQLRILERKVENIPQGSSDYKKTKEAIETFRQILEAGGEATYLKQALKQRRQDINDLISPLL